jgi:hypothetical protein
MPELDQVFDVGGEFGIGRSFGDGAHDESAGFVLWHEALHFFTQLLALGFVLDAL